MARDILAFQLRFPLAEVKHWAARYAYADDAEVEAIGRAARQRGYYTRSEFLTVARWKTPRSQSRCARNESATVRSRTRQALTTYDERLRIEALTQLHGVDKATASVLLHLAHRDPYPIIDFRALWSLGIEEPPASYSFAFWSAYVTACRELAAAAHVRMRTLDRALWQYSKEHQPARPSGRAAGTSPTRDGAGARRRTTPPPISQKKRTGSSADRRAPIPVPTGRPREADRSCDAGRDHRVLGARYRSRHGGQLSLSDRQGGGGGRADRH